MIQHRDARTALRLSVLAASVSVACAGSIAQTSDSFTVSRRAAEGVLGAPTLGRREIAAFGTRPLADALTQLRPDWLRANPLVRGSDQNSRAVVYTNDVPAGEIRALETISSDAAAEVQYLSAAAAQIRYGPACRCPGGVIRVQTRIEE